MAFWLSIGWQLVPFAPGLFIKPAQAADPDMIIFMDYADVPFPLGWEVISDTTAGSFSDVFYNRYVRGGGTYAAQGGNATHTHTLTYVIETLGATTGVDNRTSPAVQLAADTHSHGGLANQSITTNDNLPNYRSLAVLRYTLGGIPSTLPDNTILLFETASIFGNWELYSAQDARLVRGSSSTANAGNNIPTHTVASGLSATSSSILGMTASASYATTTHTHSAGAGVATDGPSIVPPYYELVFQRATAAITSFPNNMIAGFSGTAFDSPWTVVSNTAQKYNNLFLMGDSSGVLTSSGASTHSHTNPVTVTSGTPVGTGSDLDDSPARIDGASNTHTHSISINLGTGVTHTPEYTDLVLAQYATPPDLSWDTGLADFRVYASSTVVWNGGGILKCSATLTDDNAAATNCTGNLAASTQYRVEVLMENNHVNAPANMDDAALDIVYHRDALGAATKWMGTSPTLTSCAFYDAGSDDTGTPACTIVASTNDVKITNTGASSDVVIAAGGGTEGFSYLITTASDAATNSTSYMDATIDTNTENSSKIGITISAPVPLSVGGPANVQLGTTNPGVTLEYTFSVDEYVTVTAGGAGWTLSVISTNLTDGGSNSISNANVKLRTDGLLTGYTIWAGVTTNLTETAEGIYSLDTTRAIGIRSSGTNGENTMARPTIQVVVPPTQAVTDYNGDMTFTVA